MSPSACLTCLQAKSSTQTRQPPTPSSSVQVLPVRTEHPSPAPGKHRQCWGEEVGSERNQGSQTPPFHQTALPSTPKPSLVGTGAACLLPPPAASTSHTTNNFLAMIPNYLNARVGDDTRGSASLGRFACNFNTSSLVS